MIKWVKRLKRKKELRLLAKRTKLVAKDAESTDQRLEARVLYSMAEQFRSLAKNLP